MTSPWPLHLHLLTWSKGLSSIMYVNLNMHPNRDLAIHSQCKNPNNNKTSAGFKASGSTFDTFVCLSLSRWAQCSSSNTWLQSGGKTTTSKDKPGGMRTRTLELLCLDVRGWANTWSPEPVQTQLERDHGNILGLTGRGGLWRPEETLAPAISHGESNGCFTASAGTTKMMWLKIIILFSAVWTIQIKEFFPSQMALFVFLLILLRWHLMWMQQREMKIKKLEGVLKATGGPRVYHFKWIFPMWMSCLLWLSLNSTTTALSMS